MANCPYCSSQILRHVRHNHLYWFCRHCWKEIAAIDLDRHTSGKSDSRKTLDSNEHSSL